jgi:hypothetical protein
MANQVQFTFRVTGEGLEVFDQAGTKLKTIGTEADKAAKTTDAAFGRMAISAAAVGTAVAAAMTAAAAAVVHFTRAALEQQDQIFKLSQRTGIAVKELSGLRVAAELGNVSVDEMAMSIGLFNKQLVEASDTTSKSAKVLGVLGVTAREPLPALLQVADAFQKLGASTERSTAARELFGRSGERLIPVLAKGAAGIRELMKESDLLGVSFDEAAGERAEAFNDNLSRLRLAAEGLASTLAADLSRALKDVTDETVKWVEANRGLVSSEISGWVKTFIDSVKSDLLPGLEATVRELRTIKSVYDSITKAVSDRVFLGVKSGGSSSLDFQTGTGNFGTPRGDPTSEEVAVLRQRLAAALAGDTGGDKAGKDAARAARAEAKAEAQLEKQTLETFKELEEQRLAILDRQGILRQAALNYAEQDLRLARESGASEQEQLAIAERMDVLERERLESVRARLEAEIDTFPSLAVSGELEQLKTELQLVNDELARGPEHVKDLTRELQNARDVTIDLGASLNDSLQRAVDGFLNSGGKGSFADVIKNAFTAQLSSIGGGFLQALISGGDFKIKGLDGAVTNFGNFTDIFTRGVDKLVGFFGGTSAGATSSVSGAGIFGNVIAGSSSTAGAPGTGVGAFGSFTNLFGADNKGVGGSTPSSAQNLIGSIPVIGTIVAAAIGVVQGAVEGIHLYNQLKYTRGQSQNDLFGATFSRDPIGKLAYGLGGATASRAQIASLTLGTSEILLLAGLFAPKTEGTITKKQLSGILNEAGLPQQRIVELGDRTGIRARGLELAPNTETQEALRALGFGTGNLLPPGAAPHRNAQGVLLAGSVSPGTYQLGLDLSRAAAERPGVEALRGNEALGLASVLFGEGEAGRDVAPAANALVNNFLLLGIGTEEARRQLLRMADVTGVNLINGLEELSRAFNRSDKSADAMLRLQSSAAGLVDLFARDLPAALDIDEIIRRRTTSSGIDIAGVQGDITRAGIAFDLREQIKDVRFNQLNARKQDQSLRSQIADIDSQLAAADLTDPRRQQLLQERAGLGFDLASLAEARFAPGSASRRRGVEFGLGIVEESAQQLESFGVTLDETNDAQAALTLSTHNLNGTMRQMNDLLMQGFSSTLDVNIKGGGETEKAVLTAAMERAFDAFIKTEKFKAAVKTTSFNR